MKSKNVRQVVLPLLAAMIWGCSFVTQSLSAGHLGCFSFGMLRMIPASIFLFVLVCISRRRHPREKYTPAQKKTLLLAGAACGAMLTAAINLQQYGLKETSAGKAGFITALYIVLVPVFGCFAGKKPGRRVWLFVALAVAGLYLICFTGGEGFSLEGGDPTVVSLLMSLESFFAVVSGAVFLHEKMSAQEYLGCALMLAAVLLSQLPEKSAKAVESGKKA